MIEKVFGIVAVSIATFLIFGSLSEFSVIIVEDTLAPLQNTVNVGNQVESRVTFFDKLANVVVAR